MKFNLVEVPGRDMEEKLKKVEIKVIITPATWKFMEQGFFVSRWLTLHPYKWDRALKAPVVASKLSYWRLQLVTAVVFYMLLLIRLVEVVIVGPGSMVEQMYILFVMSFYSIFILTQVHATLRAGRTVCWVQGFFLLTKKCEGAILFYSHDCMIPDHVKISLTLNLRLLETYLNGFRGKYRNSERCDLILRIIMYFLRLNGFSLAGASFARTLLPQLHVPQIMPKSILQLDSHGIVGTFAVLLEISVLLSYADVAVLLSGWGFTFLLTTIDILEAMR